VGRFSVRIGRIGRGAGMTDASSATAKLGFGRVIQGTFGIIKRNFATYLILIAIFAVIPLAMVGLGVMRIAGGSIASGGGLVGVGYLASLASNALLQASLIHAAVADLNGRKATVGECLQTGVRRLPPLLAVLILYFLGVAFGMVLLLVPGIMIAIAWIVAVPSQVVERTGVYAAFTRSGRLTRNNRWRIFGLMVLWLIVVSVVQGTLSNLAGSAVTAPVGAAAPFAALGPAYWMVIALSTVFNAMVGGAGQAMIYYELRRVKEGVGPEALASVFD
jgi:hypothetical protein